MVLAIVIYVGEFEFFLGGEAVVVACVLVCNTCAFVPY